MVIGSLVSKSALLRQSYIIKAKLQRQSLYLCLHLRQQLIQPVQQEPHGSTNVQHDPSSESEKHDPLGMPNSYLGQASKQGLQQGCR